jgi:hypothetical protein
VSRRQDFHPTTRIVAQLVCVGFSYGALDEIAMVQFAGGGHRHAAQANHAAQNGGYEANRVKAILAISGANTSYSRLTIMYYRRAQPTTRGLEMVMKKATKKTSTKGSLKRAPAKKAAKKTAAKKAPAKKTAAKKPAKKAAKKK